MGLLVPLMPSAPFVNAVGDIVLKRDWWPMVLKNLARFDKLWDSIFSSVQTGALCSLIERLVIISLSESRMHVRVTLSTVSFLLYHNEVIISNCIRPNSAE